MSRLDFLCQDMGKFRPCGLTNCRSDATLAKSTIPWHINYKNLVIFYLEYLQIPDRLPNHINHAFIFNLIFNNIKSMVFGIILIQTMAKDLSLHSIQIITNTWQIFKWLYSNITVLLYQVVQWNTVSFTYHLREVRIRYFYTLSRVKVPSVFYSVLQFNS